MPYAFCVTCSSFIFFSIAPALLAPNYSKCRYSKKAPNAFQVNFKSISVNKAFDNIWRSNYWTHLRPCGAGRRAFDNADVLYTALADVRLAGSGVPSTGSAGGRLLRYSLPSQRVGRPVKGRALNSEQATEGDIFPVVPNAVCVLCHLLFLHPFFPLLQPC